MKIAVHPGGPVIEQFVGRDATEVFKGFHKKHISKHRMPVGIYERDLNDPAAEEFGKLHKYFIDNGYFNTNLKWFAMKISIAFALLSLSVVLVTSCDFWAIHYLGAIFLAAFWHQSGFFMHDFMHNHVFHEHRLDQWFGTFFGTLCFGVSGSWWGDEHFVHHVLTNTVDYSTNFVDPQKNEVVWAQNQKIFPFHTTFWHKLAIQVQHLSFVPLCVGLGRIGIIIASFSTECRLHEWMAGFLHRICLSAMLSFLPTWREVFMFYAIAAVCQGVLHIQLLVSHYSKPFCEQHKICNEVNWYRMQVECNINIVNPIWMDWFHGSLNFHIEHHLFPTMPRHNYRAASKHVKRACKTVGIMYDECSSTEAFIRTIKNMKDLSILFSHIIDPR